MRALRHLSAVVLTIVLVGTVAGPATAVTKTDGYGSLNVPAATSHGAACASSMISFSPSSSITAWTLGIHIDRPNASEGPTFQLDAATPSHTLTFCPGKDQTGDYIVKAELSATATSGGSSVFTSYRAALTFRVVNPKPTAFSVKVKRSYNANGCPLRRTKHCSLVSGHLTRAGRSFGGQYSQLQQLKRGRWVRLDWERGDGLGRYTWYLVISSKEKKAKFRLFYPSTDAGKSSASRTFKAKY